MVALQPDSRATRENDDFFLSVILEGAVRLSSGIHKGLQVTGYGLRIKAYGLFTADAVTHPLTPSRQGRGDFFRFSLFFNGLFLKKLRLPPWLRCNWIPSLRLRMTGK